MSLFLENVKNKLEEYISTSNKFIHNIRYKLGNLCQVNYETGMYHYNNGHLFEAMIRFKIITKFWPDFLDGRYQFAYILFLRDHIPTAKKELQEILKKDKNYIKAQELLEKIDIVKRVDMYNEYLLFVEEYKNTQIELEEENNNIEDNNDEIDDIQTEYEETTKKEKE